MVRTWITKGDGNAFFALFLDNIVNLVILSGILGIFGFPKEVIFQYMIPGTALGVLIGDGVYTYMAVQLAKRTGRVDVTAMPLGLDTPSTIGMAVAVLGPAFLDMRSKGMSEHDAAITAWHIGMACMLWMGLVKVAFSFVGSTLQKLIPSASLLGSLAGIGIVWLSAESLIHVYEYPFVGLVSLAIVSLTLMARHELPFKIPGAFFAVVAGCAVYYGMGFAGALGESFHLPDPAGVALTFPKFSTMGIVEMFGKSLNYLPVAIPFGLMTIVGGINCTEGARLVGDNYKTRNILLTEAFATIAAGLAGGVSQTVPYIGHSAYKSMGARAGYTLFTGLAVGIGACFGLVGFIVDLIPKASVAPILIFIGFEIASLAFHYSPKNHAVAVGFAIVPSVMNYAYIKVKLLYENVLFNSKILLDMTKSLSPEAKGAFATQISALVPGNVAHEYIFLSALGQGFVLTAMIWGACIAWLIDKKPIHAATSMAVAAIFTLFGLMHSVSPNGELYLPWNLSSKGFDGRSLTIPYEFALAYGIAGILMISFFYLGKNQNALSKNQNAKM